MMATHGFPLQELVSSLKTGCYKFFLPSYSEKILLWNDEMNGFTDLKKKMYRDSEFKWRTHDHPTSQWLKKVLNIPICFNFHEQNRLVWDLLMFYYIYLHITFTWRQWQPTPVLLPGKSRGWRNLVGCSPWGRTESTRLKQLSSSSITFIWR